MIYYSRLPLQTYHDTGYGTPPTCPPVGSTLLVMTGPGLDELTDQRTVEYLFRTFTQSTYRFYNCMTDSPLLDTLAAATTPEQKEELGDQGLMTDIHTETGVSCNAVDVHIPLDEEATTSKKLPVYGILFDFAGTCPFL